MKCRVTLVESDEGFAIWCDDLPALLHAWRPVNCIDALRLHHGVVELPAIPRHNPINAYTMGNIAKQAGFTPDEFRKLL